MEDSLIAAICFVPLMSYVAEYVCPRDTVSCADEIEMCDWAERLSYVGGISYIALSGEKCGADSSCVGSVTYIAVC